MTVKPIDITTAFFEIMFDSSMPSARVCSGALCALLATLLAGCGGGGGGSGGSSGGGAETTPGTVPQPAPATTPLTLEGKAIGVSLSNATVQTTLAGRTFTTTTDADGNYRLPISVPLDQTAAMVRLEVRGVGPQSNQELSSILGTFARLQQQAGADGILTRAENFATHVSFITTAEAAVMREDNGGAPITTDEQIRILGASMHTLQAERLAIGMYMLLAHPERYQWLVRRESALATIESLGSSTNFELLLTDYNALHGSAPEALLNDHDILITTDALSGPGTLTATVSLTHPLALHEVNTATRQFTFNPDGSGSLHDSGKSWATSWLAENSAITINHPGQTRVRLHDCGEGRHVALQVNNQSVLKQLSERLLIIESDYHVMDPLCEPGTKVTSRSTVILLHEADLSSVDATALRADGTTIYLYDPIQEQVVVDVAHLQSDGHGRTESLNAQFTWSQDAQGALLLEFNNGTTGSYRQLNALDTFGTPVLYQLDYTGGRRVGSGNLIPVDASSRTIVSASQLLGRLREYGDVSERWPDMRYRDALRLDPDGTGTVQAHLYAEGEAAPYNPQAYPRPLTWTLLPASPEQSFAELVIQMPYDPTTSEYGCTPGQGSCILQQERRLTALRIDGNRLYFLERRRSDDSGVTTDTPITTRAVFYDRHPVN